MTGQLTAADRDGRRAARAILIDDRGRLVLIKRTKPGLDPYWTAPGGGVESDDASVEAALYRELAEELGAKAADASHVFLFSSPSDAGVSVQHLFVARLVSLDESERTGPELTDASRGGYELDRVDLPGDDLVGIDLKPTALKEFILATTRSKSHPWRTWSVGGPRQLTTTGAGPVRICIDSSRYTPEATTGLEDF